MKLLYGLATCLLLTATTFGAEPPTLPKGIPPLMGKAIAQAKKGDGGGWSIALTLPQDTWREIQSVLPKLEWPEPKWEKTLIFYSFCLLVIIHHYFGAVTLPCSQ